MTTLTEKKKKALLTVLTNLVTTHTYAEMNTFLGGEEIKDIYDIYCELKYEPYCKRHNMKFEDMDEYDCELAYWEDIHAR